MNASAASYACTVFDAQFVTNIAPRRSDGGGSGGETEMTSIHREFQPHGLQVHTVAFGAGADSAKLTRLAALGDGKFHTALHNSDLITKFQELSTTATLQSELVTRFGSLLADMLTEKLMVEYL